MITDKQLEVHADTYLKWKESGEKLTVQYLAGSNVWIDCRNGIEWDVNTEYRIKYYLND